MSKAVIQSRSVSDPNINRYFDIRNCLHQHYKQSSQPQLTYSSPFQLLVATILAVQSDEATVNSVTTKLFARYLDAQAIATADSRELAKIIRPTKFQRRKVKHLQLTSEIIVTSYDGDVPCDLLALTKLPGISRRSAYQILLELSGDVEGVIVDARVWRVAQRVGLAHGHSAESIESQLATLLPKQDWATVYKLFSQHADALCTVQQPQCGLCPIFELCEQRL